RVAADSDGDWNRRILRLLEKGETGQLDSRIEDYAREARVDMGFKHFAWVRGAVGGRFFGARVHGYGPAHGAGAAVIEFRL
ncbi:MAG: tRNA U-34 5-methylaminomethyl-2-thiouridine biosynthesis protein, partial [Rhodospirillaceae bacterium]|nr:tRNA U-34 5-methylaminomethyl-2-thiouridine biosynthesis protein [Rhodospirillaceae bacterium]